MIPMLKWQKNNENKEQGKTKHEAPHSKNHKATQSKNNTRTIALERSVALTTRGLSTFTVDKSSPWVPVQFLIEKYVKSSFRMMAP